MLSDVLELSNPTAGGNALQNLVFLGLSQLAISDSLSQLGLHAAQDGALESGHGCSLGRSQGSQGLSAMQGRDHVLRGHAESSSQGFQGHESSASLVVATLPSAAEP